MLSAPTVGRLIHRRIVRACFRCAMLLDWRPIGFLAICVVLEVIRVGVVLLLRGVGTEKRRLFYDGRFMTSFRQNLRNFAVEISKLERFVDVGISAIERRCKLVETLSDAREHDDTGMMQANALTNASADFPTAHAGHHDIEHNQVGKAAFRFSPSRFSIGRLED